MSLSKMERNAAIVVALAPRRVNSIFELEHVFPVRHERVTSEIHDRYNYLIEMPVEVLERLGTRTSGRFYLGDDTIYFEEEADVTMFMLACQ